RLLRREEQIVHSDGGGVHFTLDRLLPALAPLQMQETDAHVERHSPISRRQALGLDTEKLIARQAGIPRVNTAAHESLLVLDRRGPVRIEQVTFIEYGVCDSFHEFEVHQ